MREHPSQPEKYEDASITQIQLAGRLNFAHQTVFDAVGTIEKQGKWVLYD